MNASPAVSIRWRRCDASFPTHRQKPLPHSGTGTPPLPRAQASRPHRQAARADVLGSHAARPQPVDRRGDQECRSPDRGDRAGLLHAWRGYSYELEVGGGDWRAAAEVEQVRPVVHGRDDGSFGALKREAHSLNKPDFLRDAPGARIWPCRAMRAGHGALRALHRRCRALLRGNPSGARPRRRRSFVVLVSPGYL